MTYNYRAENMKRLWSNPESRQMMIQGLKGARLRSRKLTDDQVREIRRRYAEGESQLSLAKEFGISQPVLSFMLTGKTYQEVK